MVVIKCPTCHSNLVADSLAAVGDCPTCGARFLAPPGEPGLAGPSPATQTTGPEPLDPVVSLEDEQVLAELHQLQNQQPSWSGAIGILIISLVLYLGAARADRGWDGVAIWLGVLAFHEAGHYLAMRHFGYRNLKMFFIPFFGAAVSGRHYNIAGWKKALVALAGPVPGILLGVPLGILGLALHEPLLVQAAIVSLLLNGFNLLPLLPFDGGWVVHAVLFVRHPVLDVIFRVVAALGLLALALLLRAYMLVAVAVFMLIAIPMLWRMANIAHRLRREGLVALSPDAESIPLKTALTILAALRPVLPAQTPPKVLAQNVANIFENLNATPPSPLASIGLLALHAGSFLLALVVGIGVIVLKNKGG